MTLNKIFKNFDPLLYFVVVCEILAIPFAIITSPHCELSNSCGKRIRGWLVWSQKELKYNTNE